MLISRIITAIILGALTIIGIFYLPPLWFEIIAAVLVLFGAKELSELFWPSSTLKNHLFILFSLLIFLLLEFTIPIAGIIAGCCFWIISPYLLVRYTHEHTNAITYAEFSKWLIGMLIFVPCLLSIIEIRWHFGANYLLYILITIWATDIGAYFAGRLFGKHKLAPAISPKKTIEGLIGGFILALLFAIFGGIFLLHHLSLNLILLTMVASLWSVIGDLFESMLKRQAGVKDSGHLLPGHGGVYDRIDSLAAALPIFALGLILLKII